MMAISNKVNWAVRSIACPLGRPGVKNEDSFVLIAPDGEARWLDDGQEIRYQHALWPNGHLRLSVLDGLGGHGRGGEMSSWVAARLAVMPAFLSQDEMCAALDALHHQARVAYSVTKPGERAPGTTLLVLEIPASGPAWMYHVGDSRLWLGDKDGLELLTVDHCPSTVRALRGELSFLDWQREVLHRYHRPISQAFGLGGALLGDEEFSFDLTPLKIGCLPEPLSGMPDRRSIQLPSGSVVLLATDGLWCFEQPMCFLMGLDDSFREHSENMEGFAEKLLSQHRQCSENNILSDNTTFILYRK